MPGEAIAQISKSRRMNGAPVVVTPGHTYQFQARSQKTPTQPSGWSPILAVNT